ncbi:hypothetical protein CYLTODRAFT_447471 [Cylindrobasidium torrendii FP15055 ss-10]|uniref:BTB domain-containing protein n=1 Tax=Cylindrobasidium torrendii FP15055 ss-10 TaxID=1314674 RepID=A0A0D7AXC7_9AGAR|nr:hypothetical protein CYLTODRAFT_447471 [Cylindrobasidium torrendii FP15055 ss-10]
MTLPYVETSSLGFEDGNTWVAFAPRKDRPGIARVYSFHATQLMQSSTFFESLLRDRPSGSKEAVKENPMPLPDVLSQDDWEAFCLFAFRPHEIPPEKANCPLWWSSVLRAAIPLDSLIAVKKATDTLSNLPAVDPVLKLNLAAYYEQRQWLAPAFENVVNLILNNNLSEETAKQLPKVAYDLALKTAIRLLHYRLTVTSGGPPRFTGASQTTCGKSCQEAWEREWWNGFSKNILHPVTPWSMSRVVLEAETLMNLDIKVPDMCDGCTGQSVTFGESSVFITTHAFPDTTNYKHSKLLQL